MHSEAFEFARRCTEHLPSALETVEFGSKDINGSVRSLLEWRGPYVGIDWYEGPGVDVQADAREYPTTHPVDVVVCMETAEHCPTPEALIENAWHVLKRGGLLIFTAAAPPRQEHSGLDGGPLRDDEYYANIEPNDLRKWLDQRWAILRFEYHSGRGDVYALARKL